MSWAKLDDGFWAHPKVVRAGNEGAGIFARCLSYSGAYLTDGLIPMPVAIHIAGTSDALQRVIDAGLLHTVETLEGPGVHVRDWSDFNPLRDEVEAQRQARAEAGRRGGIASGHTRRDRRRG